jgi:lipoprotein-releasing system permease protein
MSRSSSLFLRSWPFPLLLALRYVRSTRRDAFASFLSAVAAGGIGLGVIALVLSLAVISGFQEALRGEILGRSPQIQIELPPGTTPDAANAARNRVRSVPGVVGARVMIQGNGWLVSGGKVVPVDLVGFEGKVPAWFPGAAGAPEGVYVPGSIANRWGLVSGRRVEIVTPQPTLTPLGPQPRSRSLVMAGTYSSGRTLHDRDRVALPLAPAEGLLGAGSLELEVVTASLDSALQVAKRLAPMVPPRSEIRTWSDLNRPLLFALLLEKVMMFIAVSLIIVVAALALVADLALIISSKRPEIGILATMGATPRTLSNAFVLLGGLVAASGAIVGGVIGVGSAWVLDRYHLVPVPGKVYFLDYVPFLVKPRDLAFVIVLTLSLALASSLYAARRAAALDPIEAMRR